MKRILLLCALTLTACTKWSSVVIFQPSGHGSVSGAEIRRTSIFVSSDRHGRYDRMRIQRFSINEADTLAGVFGNTGKKTPYETSLSGPYPAGQVNEDDDDSTRNELKDQK